MRNMTTSEFREKEVPGLMEIFDFSSNMAASVYTDTTAVRIPGMISSGSMISDTHFLQETYLLNRKRSSLDLGVGYGVMRYQSFGARGCISQRKLAEDEEKEREEMMIRLPAFAHLKAPLGTVLRTRRSRRDMTEKHMNIGDLSTILYYGDGVSGEIELASSDSDDIPSEVLGNDYSATLRTAPSGGGLYPVTLYAAVRNTSGIPDGIYRYLPINHMLSRIRNINPLTEQELKTICEWGSGINDENINIMIFYVYGLYDNSGKYLDMALDFALIETGHISENIHLACTSLGVSSCDIGGFDKYRTEKLLGLDGMNSTCLGVTIIGR